MRNIEGVSGEMKDSEREVPISAEKLKVRQYREEELVFSAESFACHVDGKGIHSFHCLCFFRGRRAMHCSEQKWRSEDMGRRV